MVALASGPDFELDAFGGGGTWQSFVTAVIESVIVVAMTLWLFDVFRRRANRQRPFARAAGRAAFAAFLVHQLVLVWLVLASHSVAWPPEVKLLTVAVLGLAGSFAAGALLTRMPGVRRFT